MIVLGFDPGGVEHNATTGYAVIDWRGARSHPEAYWIVGGTIAPIQAVIAHLLARYAPDLVAVERPGVLFNPCANRAVLATADVGGDIGGQAKALGYRVVKLEPREWRKPFVGNGQAKDSAIKETLWRICSGVPKRTANHSRDAAGLAIIAGRMHK